MTRTSTEPDGQTRRAPVTATLPLALIVVVTTLRIWALANDRTDLFVDETQYWLWGQSLDLGYFSKPPMIAWLLRAVTDLAGQDSAFWIRVPAPVLHGLTALILARMAAGLYGTTAATLVALSYLTLPIVGVGSFLISTDTLAAPYYAAALALFLGAGGVLSTRRAAAIGALVGLAVMAKYAGVYFYLCFATAAWLVPEARPGWRKAAVMALATLVVVAPNIAWNVRSDMVTLRHLADNMGWLEGNQPWAGLSLVEFARFLASQVGAIGPILAAGLVWVLVQATRAEDRILLAFSVPILALVGLQALLSGANANWAFLAVIAATPLVVGVLWQRRRAVLAASLVLNGAASIWLATLYVAPQVFTWDGRPVAARFLGRAEFSRELIRFAEDNGAAALVAENREILADLHYTGRDSGFPIHSLPDLGPPRHHYDLNLALPPGLTGPVVWIGTGAPSGCDVLDEARPDLAGGAYAQRGFFAMLVEASCLTPGAER